MEGLGLLFVFFALLFASGMGGERKARRKRAKDAYKFDPEDAHGGAAFADARALKKAGLFKRIGVPIGYFGRALHYPGIGHILTVAATRTGKGATLLVNALLSWMAIARMPLGSEIVSAMDADADGEKLTEIVRRAVQLTGRLDLRFTVNEPMGAKDFNDQLRAKPQPFLPYRPDVPSVA